MTLKGMNDKFNSEGFIDYYVNKVREEDVDKFTEFKQVQITVFKPKR